MQTALAIHALMAVPLVAWAVRVRNGSLPDPLFSSLPGFSVGLALVLWMFSWWGIARVRPMAPYREQPVAKFHGAPAGIAFLLQLIAIVVARVLVHDYPDATRAMFIVEFMVLIGALLGFLSWLCARIRFHIGSWVLAWCVWFAGFYVGALSLGDFDQA
jgi:hypothetical protein